MLKKWILVVEDFEDFQMLLQQLLEKQGFLVTCASNGAEAIHQLESAENLPDLILLDLMMPIVDGFEFRKMQKAHPRFANVPVVIMSAHGDVQATKLSMGAQDSMRKPAEMQQILDVVQRNVSPGA